MIPNVDYTHVGSNLVRAAEEQDDDVLPLSTRLFPYIFIASRKMSFRTISSWLKDNHDVSLSAAAISRALANPGMHLLRLAQSFIPRARYVGTAYGGMTPFQLLYGQVFEGGPNELEVIAGKTKNPRDESDIPAWGELQALADDWETIPHEVRLMMKPFVKNEGEDDEELATIRYDEDEL